jgi:hypothetical protein
MVNRLVLGSKSDLMSVRRSTPWLARIWERVEKMMELISDSQRFMNARSRKPINPGIDGAVSLVGFERAIGSTP